MILNQIHSFIEILELGRGADFKAIHSFKMGNILNKKPKSIVEFLGRVGLMVEVDGGGEGWGQRWRSSKMATVVEYDGDGGG